MFLHLDVKRFAATQMIKKTCQADRQAISVGENPFLFSFLCCYYKETFGLEPVSDITLFKFNKIRVGLKSDLLNRANYCTSTTTKTNLN